MNKKISKFNLSTMKKKLFNKKISTTLTLFSFLEVLAISNIILVANAPPPPHEFYATAHAGDWTYPPIQPDEIVHSFPVIAAKGQRIFINISTTNVCTLKLISVNSTMKHPTFSDETMYITENSTNHIFLTETMKEYTIYYVYLGNVGSREVSYSGYIEIQGFNTDYFLIPILILFLYVFVRTLNSLKKIIISLRKSNLAERNQISLSFLSRLIMLYRLQVQEFGIYHVLISTFLLWILVQPMTTIQTLSSSRFQVIELLQTAEKHLITPIFFSIFFMAILISLDTAKAISAKKSRQDIISLLSLPFNRSEWFFSIFLWFFSLYSMVFLLLFLFKAYLLRLQIPLHYPLTLLHWCMFFLLILVTWILIGLVISLISSNQMEALTKTIFLISMDILFNTLFPRLFNGGITGTLTIAERMWLGTIQVEGKFVKTQPDLSLMILSILPVTIWFLIAVLSTIKLTKHREVV